MEDREDSLSEAVYITRIIGGGEEEEEGKGGGEEGEEGKGGGEESQILL